MKRLLVKAITATSSDLCTAINESTYRHTGLLPMKWHFIP